MKIDKKKHFTRLPIYLVIVYFLASIPITIYLAHNSTQSKQYAQSYPDKSPQYVSPTYNCLANECPGISVSPSNGIYISPSGQVVTSPATTTISLSPPSDPCASSSSVATQSYGGHSNNDGNEDYIKFLVDLFIMFLNFILQLLGYPQVPPPGGSPVVPNPGGPSPIGGLPPVTSPNPCIPGNVSPSVPLGGNVSPIIVSPGLSTSPSTTPGQNGGTNANVRVTFYTGFETGGLPEGNVIAEPVLHQRAGGTGTYSDPLTFAAANGAYAKGTIIYVPSVQKYFVREDLCAATDPNCKGDQVDLYVGNPSNTQVANQCARDRTSPSGSTSEIIISPPSGLTYDSTPIWSESSGCMTLH